MNSILHNSKFKFYTLSALSIIYLFFESSFFVSLNHIIANNTVHTFDNIEKVGRTLSGGGFAFLIAKNYFNKITIPSVTVRPILLIVCFLFAFQGQKLFTDALVEYLPPQIKESLYKGYMIQRAISNNLSANNTSQSDIFITNVQTPLIMPTATLLAMGGRTVNDKSSKQVFEADLKTNLSYYYQKYLVANEKYLSMVNNVSRMNRQARADFEDEAERAYYRVYHKYDRLPNRYKNQRNNPKTMAKFRKQLKEDHHLVMPQTWNLKNESNAKTVFFAEFTRQFDNKLREKITQSVQSRYGITLPTSYAYKPLQHSQVTKVINSKLDVFAMSSGFKPNLNEENFYFYYKHVFPINMNNKFAKGTSNPEHLDNVIRIFLIPFLALSFSALFIVLNTKSFISANLRQFAFKGKHTPLYRWLDRLLLLSFLSIPVLVASSLLGSGGFAFSTGNNLNASLMVLLKFLSTVSYILNYYLTDIHYNFFAH